MGTGLDGTCRFNDPVNLGGIPTDDLATITLSGRSYEISSSRPFLAFQSENQKCSNSYEGRLNMCSCQRIIDPIDPCAFDKQVRAWYRSVALTSYHLDVQPVLKSLVRSIGTGPWGAGLWFGDSQLMFLASWIGQAAAAPTWGASLDLDYYIYSAFTENPANQCYVHSKATCKACMARCSANPLPSSSYWLPHGGSCVVSSDVCGQNGLENVVAAYEKKDALALWSDVETSIKRTNLRVDNSVFDNLLSR